jgi:hypothetical protein
MAREIPVVAAKRKWFEYHCYEGEDSSDAELWRHTHQQVTVVREEPWREWGQEVPMFAVRFDDGLEYTCWGDELLDSPAEFERPDYARAAQ